MVGTADQARPGTEPAQASITPGRPETLAGVQGEIRQLELRRGPQFDDLEHLAIQA
jgi:hypothetical protein